MKPFRGIDKGRKYMTGLGFSDPVAVIVGTGTKLVGKKVIFVDPDGSEDNVTFTLLFDTDGLCYMADFSIKRNGVDTVSPVRYELRGGEFLEA